MSVTRTYTNVLLGVYAVYTTTVVNNMLSEGNNMFLGGLYISTHYMVKVCITFTLFTLFTHGRVTLPVTRKSVE